MESKLEERFLRRRRNLSLQAPKNYDVPSDKSSPILKDEPEKFDDEKYIVKGVLSINADNNANNHSHSSSNSNITSGSQAYRTKLLGRKERSSRASRAPKAESSSQTNDDILTFMRRARRSLSAPRKKEDVDKIDPKITPQMQKKKIENIETESYELSNTSASDEVKAVLEANLRKFDEERRNFELEKLKLLEEKRDFDRLRLQRFEKYKKERENNESQVKVARKIVFDYEKLETQKDLNVANENFNVEIQDITDNDKLNTNGFEDNEFHDAQNEIIVDKKGENVAPQNHVETENHVEPVEEPMLTKRTKQSLESTPNNQKMELNGHQKEISKTESEQNEIDKVNNAVDDEKIEITTTLLKEILKDMLIVWKKHLKTHANEWVQIKAQIRTCAADVLLLILLCGIGGLVFRYIEGNFENLYKCGVKRVKRDFIDQLWTSSHNLKEDDWKSMARTRLRKFEEELHTAFEAGMNSYSGHTAWNFVNGVLYCLTIISTIGYGHITPSTNTGRAITIIYAIFGIPIFLILLADFGKLFTRGIKFVWLYVRRLYYTGTFRKIRKATHTQEMMKGLNTMYDFVRRPSFGPDAIASSSGQNVPTPESIRHSEVPNSPVPPSLDHFEIDDEFNLPISVAITILVGYMLVGATMYSISEPWSFFESFYFVFVSISTIGLGDFVPTHPLYMLFSIIYLIFGLSLTSMCINVVQVKLSDSFRNASTKISTTIGMQMAEAASQQATAPQSPDSQDPEKTVKPIAIEASAKPSTEI